MIYFGTISYKIPASYWIILRILVFQIILINIKALSPAVFMKSKYIKLLVKHMI